MTKSKKLDKMSHSKPIDAQNGCDTRITDLDHVCLANICKFLNLQNLMNVAVVSKQFNEIAGEVFEDEYGSKTIETDRLLFSNFHARKCDVQNDKIIITKPSTFVTLLSTFGCYITKLSVNFGGMTPYHCRKIENFINQYCGDSLVELHLKHCHELAMTEIQKPFEQVEFVSIADSHLGQKISQFNRLFPNMQRLQLNNNDVFNRMCIGKNFMHLHDLTVDIEGGHRNKNGFRVLDVTKALRSNRQIQLLTLRGDFNQSLVSIVDTVLPQLSYFELDPSAVLFTSQKETVSTISNIVHMKLSVPDLSQHLLIQIPFVCTNLRELDMSIGSHVGEFFDFVGKTKTLEKLKVYWIHSKTYAIIDEAIVAALKLPKIVEFSLTDFTILAPQKIVPHIVASESLKKFRMNFSSESSLVGWNNGNVSVNDWTVIGDETHVQYIRTP